MIIKFFKMLTRLVKGTTNSIHRAGVQLTDAVKSHGELRYAAVTLANDHREDTRQIEKHSPMLKGGWLQGLQDFNNWLGDRVSQFEEKLEKINNQQQRELEWSNVRLEWGKVELSKNLEMMRDAANAYKNDGGKKIDDMKKITIEIDKDPEWLRGDEESYMERLRLEKERVRSELYRIFENNGVKREYWDEIINNTHFVARNCFKNGRMDLSDREWNMWQKMHFGDDITEDIEWFRSQRQLLAK